MLIHAYLRKETTEVELFGRKYEFKPNEFKHCVAEVAHEGSIARLLSIKEAYKEYGVEAAASVSPVAGDGDEPEVHTSLLGSSTLPAEIELADDRFVTLGDVVRAAFERTGLTLEHWNQLTDQVRDELLKAEVNFLKVGLETTDEDDEAAEQREREESARALAEAEATAAAATAAAAAEAAKALEKDAGANPLILTNGDNTIDLTTWTAKQVRAFAAENGVDLPAGNSTPVGELRLLLAKGLKGE